MSGHGEKLTRSQEAAIAALLAQPTLARAAAAANINERTLRRWLDLPEFARAYRAARRQLVERAIGLLQQTTGKAAAALRRNLKCGRPGDEIRAAVAVLEHATKGVELLDLLERVEAIEAKAKGKR